MTVKENHQWTHYEHAMTKGDGNLQSHFECQWLEGLEGNCCQTKDRFGDV